MGDFNIDLNRNSYDSDALHNFCTINHLYIVPFSSTHHTASAHSRIDHCIVSDSTLIKSYNQRPLPFLSAHDLIEVTLNLSVHRMLPRVITIRDHSNFNPESFRQSLATLDWSAIAHSSSLDAGVALFTKFFVDTRDHHVPLRSFRARKPPAPWLDRSIKSVMRRRDAARRRLRGCPLPADLDTYHALRNEVSRLIDSARENYVTRRLESAMSVPRLWAELRSLGLAKPKSNTPFPDFSPDELNSFFTSIQSTLHPDPSLSHPYPSSPTGHSYYSSLTALTPSADPTTFYFSYVTPDILRRAFARCCSNAVGPDDINRRLLLDSLPITFYTILDLFNSSLNTATFPSSWKLSLVIAVPKTKNPSSPSDFRPISQQCYLSKVLERIVFDQLSTHLQTHSSLDPFQTGFRRGNSTQTALIRLTDDVRLAIDRRMVTILILFDYSKAFDMVRHDLLLRKLSGRGISDAVLRWFASYLAGRSQRVQGQNGLSSWTPISLGVPQESVLGPLLFSIFIDDLQYSITHCRHLLYADDLQIYYHFPPRDLESALVGIREDIEAIECWSRRNGLSMNVGKTKAILLGSARFVNTIRVNTDIDLYINGSRIDFVDQVTDLGVRITSTLNSNY